MVCVCVGGCRCKHGLFGWPCRMLVVLMDIKAITHAGGMSRMYS